MQYYLWIGFVLIIITTIYLIYYVTFFAIHMIFRDIPNNRPCLKSKVINTYLTQNNLLLKTKSLLNKHCSDCELAL